MTVEVAWGGQQHCVSAGCGREITHRGGESLHCQPGAEPWASPGSRGFSKLQSFLEYRFSLGVV